jgi:hypothetical protein
LPEKKKITPKKKFTKFSQIFEKKKSLPNNNNNNENLAINIGNFFQGFLNFEPLT